MCARDGTGTARLVLVADGGGVLVVVLRNA